MLKLILLIYLEALDADGKGTFIPLNVKRALYTDGKKTGTLKDYLDLIRIKPEKPDL